MDKTLHSSRTTLHGGLWHCEGQVFPFDPPVERRGWDFWYFLEHCHVCGTERLVPKTPEERGEPQPPAMFKFLGQEKLL